MCQGYKPSSGCDRYSAVSAGGNHPLLLVVVIMEYWARVNLQTVLVE